MNLFSRWISSARSSLDGESAKSPLHEPRISDRAFGEFVHGSGSIYDDVVTLDPDEALDSWSVLGLDTWALETAHMPRVLHLALIRTLRERGFVQE